MSDCTMIFGLFSYFARLPLDRGKSLHFPLFRGIFPYRVATMQNIKKTKTVCADTHRECSYKIPDLYNHFEK